MKEIWVYSHLWTYEKEFPRTETVVLESKELAIKLLMKQIEDNKKENDDYWEDENLVVTSDLDFSKDSSFYGIEAYIDGMVNTTLVNWYISKSEIVENEDCLKKRCLL